MPLANAASTVAAPLAMWTRIDDKLLELLLVRYPQRWDIIASLLVGKTPEQAFQRFERTFEEVTRLLFAPEVETPREWDVPQVAVAACPVAELVVPAAAACPVAAPVAATAVTCPVAAPVAAAADAADSESGGMKRKRKKPEKWTEEEHNRFLEYLEQHGAGKWKAMSEYLTTKSAAQIASHYQKHCNRSEQRKLNRVKRASIHDITQPTTRAGDPAVERR